MKSIYLLFFVFFSITCFPQCIDCGNGVVDAGETTANCPQDVSHDATCTSPCSQPTAFESTTGVRDAYDFVGATTYATASLPTGWAFAGAPTVTTAGALPAADAYGAKAGLVQPNCSGSCTGTNGFCIGNLANSVAVGTGGISGKLGANFDGRANIAQNLSYAVLRGQNNPTLVSPTYSLSGVEGFKIQFWLFPSEASCGQSNSWGACVGNVAYLDFSANGGTSWTQMLTMNLSSTNSDMCTNNSTNTLWMTSSGWSRVCLTVFKTSASPGNFYPAATSTSAASGIMTDATFFTSNFKYRIRYAQTASCTSGITTTNPGRYLAIDYPILTSGNQMIPCGISFSNMCGYGADNNDDGVGSTAATTSTVAFGTVLRGVNNAERGVEIFTSQTSAFASQNLSGSTFPSNFDLCNAEGGDRQCVDWRTNTNFYYGVYECIADWEAPSATGISVQYYNGTTPQSTGMSKVTTAGKTAAIGWRYSASRIVSCGSSSDLNAGCNGYSFLSGSLPTQFSRGFYQLAINSLGRAWTFYGATSCSNYFNGPSFAPIAMPDTISSGAGNYVTCSGGAPVFTGVVDYCSSPVGFTGNPQLTITGPNGFTETINSGDVGINPIVDPGSYYITATPPSNPTQCLNCSRSVCITVTTADLDPCLLLPVELLNFDGKCEQDEMVLNWCTASEKNNDYFVIEQSADGIDYKVIATVKGHGTAEEKHCYSVTANPVSDMNYFRLKQTDLDKEKTQKFKVISIASCRKNDRSVLITNDGTQNMKLLTHFLSGQTLQLYIYDILGQLVQSETIEVKPGESNQLIHLKHDLKGTYSVSLYSATEKLVEKKILLLDN
ncbi:MAG: T9SS type A sorting domain-containing protein [Bacteroidota bacterium]